jgi:hypothetical protein
MITITDYMVLDTFEQDEWNFVHLGIRSRNGKRTYLIVGQINGTSFETLFKDRSTTQNSKKADVLFGIMVNKLRGNN